MTLSKRRLHTLQQAAMASGRFPVDAGRALLGQPSASSTYLLIRRTHVLTGGRSTKALARVLRAAQLRRLNASTHVHRRAAQCWGKTAATLKAIGYAKVPNALSPAELDQLVAFATDGPAKVTDHNGSSLAGTYRHRGPDAVSVQLNMSFLLAQPALQAMLARAMATEISIAGSGVWPTLHPPILYWSCRNDDAASNETEVRLARRFHSDFDGLGGLRLHVYLTDVDERSAPMDYVPTSHIPGALPRSVRRDVTDPIPDNTVYKLFPDNPPHTITGPAGTSFISDSNGLHRGNTPQKADRLFLVMPLQAGVLAGAFNRKRSIPVVDDEFGAALNNKRPDLRLFEAAPAKAPKIAFYTDSYNVDVKPRGPTTG